MIINTTPEAEPENYDHYNYMEWDDWVQMISENVNTTKTRPVLWRYLRDELNMSDTVDALNELRIAQEIVAKGKRLANNPSWKDTMLYVRCIEARLQGCKTRRHERQVAEYETQIKNLQAKLDKYETAT